QHQGRARSPAAARKPHHVELAEGCHGHPEAPGPLRDRRVHAPRGGSVEGRLHAHREADGRHQPPLQQGRRLRQQPAHHRHAEHGQRSQELGGRRLRPRARPREPVHGRHRRHADLRHLQFDADRGGLGAAHRSAHPAEMSARLRVVRGAIATLLSIPSASAVPATDTTNAELIRGGQYLATAGDCLACHTAPGGKPYAGGLALPTPLGAIIATNITPSKTAGIGSYTLAQFTDALRKGIRADGKHLYPAMPYTSYAKVTDEDVQALYAYFMHAVEPVDAAPDETRLPFPFNIRLSMAVWNLLFLDRAVFQPDATRSAAWNRGAYLARGLAHCGTCHTPRNALMAENQSRELGGGEVGTWYAPNITSDANSGVGGWSEKELVDYMRLGRAANKSQAGGPMAEAIDHSLRHMADEDLRAIATYLKTVPALHE